MPKQHKYHLITEWAGNTGKGTSGYSSYERSHSVRINGKADILCSSDPAFRGDNTKHNPEELLVASLSGCHMLWYLHFCSDAGIVVTAYSDNAMGTMEEDAAGSGRFTEVILNPTVTVTEVSMKEKARELHNKAHEFCFIANSMNFPVRHQPTIVVKE